MLRTGLVVIWMVVVLTGCGGEEAATSSDVDAVIVDTVAVVDSLIDGPVEGTPADQLGGPGPDVGDAPTVADPPPVADRVTESPPEEPNQREEPTPREAGAEPPPLPARYQLGSVEGEALPVTIGIGPECELQLAHGDLWIKENLDFELHTTVQEVCGGERAGDDVHTAEGSVMRDGTQLRFEARYDSLFGTASGRYLPEGHIVIETLETEGGEQEVEWRFLR